MAVSEGSLLVEGESGDSCEAWLVGEQVTVTTAGGYTTYAMATATLSSPTPSTSRGSSGRPPR
jgi:hypothetical protein